MTQKAFFRERTKTEMKNLKSNQAFRQRGLVGRIDGLPKEGVFRESGLEAAA